MVVLDHILSSRTLVPVRTDYMVIYPGLLSWDTVAANKLLFFHNGANLIPHPDVVYLLVHVFSPPPQVMLCKRDSVEQYGCCALGLTIAYHIMLVFHPAFKLMLRLIIKDSFLCFHKA